MLKFLLVLFITYVCCLACNGQLTRCSRDADCSRGQHCSSTYCVADQQQWVNLGNNQWIQTGIGKGRWVQLPDGQWIRVWSTRNQDKNNWQLGKPSIKKKSINKDIGLKGGRGSIWKPNFYIVRNKDIFVWREGVKDTKSNFFPNCKWFP